MKKIRCLFLLVSFSFSFHSYSHFFEFVTNLKRLIRTQENQSIVAHVNLNKESTFNKIHESEECFSSSKEGSIKFELGAKGRVKLTIKTLNSSRGEMIDIKGIEINEEGSKTNIVFGVMHKRLINVSGEMDYGVTNSSLSLSFDSNNPEALTLNRVEEKFIYPVFTFNLFKFLNHYKTDGALRYITFLGLPVAF